MDPAGPRSIVFVYIFPRFLPNKDGSGILDLGRQYCGHPVSKSWPTPLVDKGHIHAPSTCTMGLDPCTRHSLFGCTDPYYTVTFSTYPAALGTKPLCTLTFPPPPPPLGSYPGFGNRVSKQRFHRLLGVRSVVQSSYY